ncbi:MAG: TetR/AcrR family transcriptional regulator [Polyangiaceae bacterium]
MTNRKDEIVEIATRLFAERGYEGASMGDLAECVGLRKASLFHHYASKDELYIAVLECLVGRLGGLVAQTASGPGTFSEKLDRMTEATFDAFVTEPFAARLMVREMMDWGPFAKKSFETVAKPVLEASEAFLLSGQTEGVAREQSPRQALLTLISAHLLPYSIGTLIEHAWGATPFAPDFVAERKKAVRDHIRAFILKPEYV